MNTNCTGDYTETKFPAKRFQCGFEGIMLCYSKLSETNSNWLSTLENNLLSNTDGGSVFHFATQPNAAAAKLRRYLAPKAVKGFATYIFTSGLFMLG